MMQRHGEHKNLRKKRGTARSYMRRILAGLCCGAIVFGTVLDRNLTTSYGAGETEKGEALIKFPTAGNMEKPSGYEKVEFQNTRFQSKPGEVTVSGNPRVIFWVKSGTTWGQVASDPSFYLPETNTAAGEFLLSWARNGNYPADAFDKEGLSATPITGDWIFSATVDDLVQEKTDNVGFENFISKTYAAVDRPKFRGITLDADGGTMNGISGKYIVVHKDVTYDNAALQKILEASMPQKEGNEFVRWQTDANQVLPKTGTIATQTYKALYIKYPEKKVSVFNKAQLGAREKEAVERAVREANAATAGLFREVKVSEDGAVIVTYTGGESAVLEPQKVIQENKEAVKNEAKAEIEKVAKQEEADIQASSLTKEEKAAKLEELKQAKAAADTAIDNAQTEAAVEDAINKGTESIQGIPLALSPKKTEAKQKLAEVYNQKKAELAKSVLTEEEKADKQKELDQQKKIGEEAIDKAQTDAEVDEALRDEGTAIQKMDVTKSRKREEAKKALKEAYDKKEEEILSSALTDTEKTAKQIKIDQIRKETEEAIDKGTTNAAVEKALKDGVTAIEETDATKSPKKEEAKKKLEEAYQQKKEEITKSALTEEEKAAKQKELDQAKKEAEKAIDQAQTDSMTEKAVEDGVAAIQNIRVGASDKKKEAEKKLEEAYQQKREEIAKAVLTDEEKATRQNELDQAKKEAEEAIGQAATNSEVEKALEDGVAAIEKIDVTKSANKEAAKKKLEEAYQQKLEEIAKSALTEEEKAAKQKELEQAKKEAEKAIDQAQTDPMTEKAVEDGVAAIQKIRVGASDKKKEAEKKLEEAYQQKREEIAKAVLTDEEKAARQNELDQAKKEAEEAIGQAATNSEVEKALEDGVAAIQKIDVTKSPKKEEVKKKLEEAYQQKKEEITKSALTEEEKVAKQKELDQAKKEAEKAIDQAQTDPMTEKALEDGVAAIQKIDVTKSPKKEEAKKKLEEAYQQKKEEITKSALTEEEKVARQKELDQAKKEAEEAIGQAATNSEVEQALKDGVAAIQKIATSSIVKKLRTIDRMKQQTNLTKAPKTGDPGNIGLFGGLSMASLAGILFAGKRKINGMKQR